MRAFYAFSFLLAWALATHGQGTVLFRNFDAATGFNAPAFHDDCVTRLSGTEYRAELLAASDFAGPWQSIAQTPFLTGAQAGYFDGGLCTISNFPSGSQPLLSVRVWNTQFGSYAAAQASDIPDTWTRAITFRVTLGGQQSPAVLTNLPALWLNNYLDVPPVPLYVNFNRVDNTAVVSWETYLEVSTNLVQWTNFAGSSPHAFPLSQGPTFFRSKMYP